MPSNKRLISMLVILSSLLSACGFHLRGYSEHNTPAAFSTLKLECANTRAWQLCQSLRQQLLLNNILLSDEAQYRLVISPIAQDSRTLSLQSNASAAEYGLSSKVDFQLIDRKTDEVIADQEVVVRNSYRHQSSALLAKERERDELQTELSQQIALEIFRQIDVLNKQVINSKPAQD